MKKIIAIIAVLISLLAFNFAQAGLLNDNKLLEYNNNLNNLAGDGYNKDANLANLIGTIIRLALSLVGAIFLVLAFIAGNNWMQAAGNEEKTKKAKATIRNLLIGLCLILAAYLMSSFLGSVFSRLLLTSASK